MDNTLERQFYGMDLMNGGMYYAFDFILNVSYLQTIRDSLLIVVDHNWLNIVFFIVLTFRMIIDFNPLFLLI